MCNPCTLGKQALGWLLMQPLIARNSGSNSKERNDYWKGIQESPWRPYANSQSTFIRTTSLPTKPRKVALDTTDF